MSTDRFPSQAASAEPAAAARALQIERYGLTWSGLWKVEDDRLVVTSNYGSRARPVRETEDPSCAAEAVLGAIVSNWRVRKT